MTKLFYFYEYRATFGESLTNFLVTMKTNFLANELPIFWQMTNFLANVY